MPLATHAINQPRFSNVETRVQAVARRQAIGQLMRVPWAKFRRAYEEYPRWQALALWTQAIIEAQNGIPSWLVTDLQKRCPDFIDHEEDSQELELMSLHLLEWAHDHEFGYAKREGWLDALTFYGVRHPRSESVWAYWEQCNHEWNNRQPNVFPAFDEWWQQAPQRMLCDKISYCDLGEAVEKHLDWEALVLWLRPLFVSNITLPPHVTSEVKRRCLGILECQNSGASQGSQKKSKIWRHLIRWGKDHCLSDAKEAGRLGALLQRVQSHPLHVRLVIYGKRWAKAWPRNRSQAYPSFRQWRRAAYRYILADQN